MRINHNNVTVPAMPAALRKVHRPTLIFKMPIEVHQEQGQERKPGHYSIVVPRIKED